MNGGIEFSFLKINKPKPVVSLGVFGIGYYCLLESILCLIINSAVVIYGAAPVKRMVVLAVFNYRLLVRVERLFKFFFISVFIAEVTPFIRRLRGIFSFICSLVWNTIVCLLFLIIAQFYSGVKMHKI